MARILFWLLLVVVALPLGVIAFNYTHLDYGLWQHLADTVLSQYVTNSLLLALGVGIGTGTIGTGLAWCLTRYQFFGSRWLAWFAVLPLAVPAYIIAYTYTGYLDFSGPIQTSLRTLFGWGYGDYWFPEIRSIGGAIAMLSLVLFPYVYLLARNALVLTPPNLIQAAQSLGMNNKQVFWKVIFPVARPAILAGVMLTMMEALADYGTVAFFGVSTFTTGIFRTWFGMGSQSTALQLAGVLVVFVFSCVYIEQVSRRKMLKEAQVNATQPRKITGFKSTGLFLLCLLPVILGFILPVIQLINWAFLRQSEWQLSSYLPLVGQTLMIASTGAVVTTAAAFFLSYVRRFNPDSTPLWTLNFASLGYALPGVVIAVGLLVPFGFFDKYVNRLTVAWFDYQPGLILSGTLFTLLIAYLVRFLAVALQHTQSGLSSITPSMDNAAESLGHPRFQIIRRIHFPLMKNSIIAAVLLVFVDIMKELPATLVLRPFNFNTLAIKAYEFAMDERLQQAALPSITIVLCGVAPVFLLIKQIRKNETMYVNRD